MKRSHRYALALCLLIWLSACSTSPVVPTSQPNQPISPTAAALPASTAVPAADPTAPPTDPAPLRPTAATDAAAPAGGLAALPSDWTLKTWQQFQIPLPPGAQLTDIATPPEVAGQNVLASSTVAHPNAASPVELPVGPIFVLTAFTGTLDDWLAAMRNTAAQTSNPIDESTIQRVVIAGQPAVSFQHVVTGTGDSRQYGVELPGDQLLLIFTADAPPEAALILANLTISSAAPDGPVIVYQRPANGSIEALNTVSGTTVVLADPTDADQRLPFSVAPDGRSIALISGRNWMAKDPQAVVQRAALWTVGIDGSNPRKLLDLNSSDGLPIDPPSVQTALLNETMQLLSWTPDGGALLVTSAHEGQVDLYLVTVNGRAVTRLTNTPAQEFQATLSPDGGAVAYGSVETFGTGAGWGGVGAWIQELANNATYSIMAQPTDSFSVSGLSLGGWLNDREVLAQSWTNDPSVTTLWTASRSNGVTVSLNAAGALWDRQGGTVAFTDDTAEKLLLWPEGAAGGSVVAAAPNAKALYLSPDKSTSILCNGDWSSPLDMYVVRNGSPQKFGSGECEHVAWSADGQRFAINGSLVFGTNGLIAGADGGVEQSLPVGALPVAWHQQALYFFAPLPHEPQLWQLYRTAGPLNAQVAPIGTPVFGVPEAPRLVVN